MPTYRDEVVVLRTHKLGEADRIVTMLSRRHGKIRAVAKGVRRTSSRFGSRLEPFKRLAATLKEHLGGVVRGMLDGRSNAYVEAMNSLLQKAKAAARGFRDPENFIAIAYLRMSKLEHLPQSPLVPAIARDYGRYRHVC